MNTFKLWGKNRLLRSALHCNGGKSHRLNDHISSSVCTKQLSTKSSLFKPLQVDDNTKPILYSYWTSSCWWRVRIALNHKMISYEIRPIDLIKSGGEQHSDKYRGVNPMKKVPTLQIDGHSIIESVAIMHYLEETRPQPPLLPQDVHKRVRVLEIVEIICSGIQPLQNLGVLKYFAKEKRENWAQQWINRGFCALEEILSTSAGKYCVDDEITMADCCLLPQAFNARRYNVDMRQYPIITRIESELLKIPAFSDSHPNKQPDCPTKSQKV